jgi:hypothetical protein
MAGTPSGPRQPGWSGSVLLYPYYTVRADGGGNSTAYYDTLISVVNTTTSFKAVKVRFLEGKRSAEVLDFNLFLSPRDVWTGACAPPTALDVSATTPAWSRRACSRPLRRTPSTTKNFIYAAAPDGAARLLTGPAKATSKCSRWAT